MKATRNREIILRLLDENLADCGHVPPYSASDLHYALHENGFYDWYAEQDRRPPPKGKPPSIQQIHRTLKDLEAAGLVVAEYRIDNNPGSRNLPQRVAYWQRADKQEFNQLVKTCHDIHGKIERGKFGANLFGAIVDQGLPPAQVEDLKRQIKALMQQTHPDNAPGYEKQFQQLQNCMTLIKSGIPNQITL